jgi:ethylmalonyl-CoA/methylmalonyl-CoA decarboxylase
MKAASAFARRQRFSYASRSAFGSLSSRHRSFLNLVGDHGDGFVSLDREGPVAEIVISNPARKNAMSGRMMKQLVGHIDYLMGKEGDSITCLVLRADEGCNMFCSGLDLTLAQEVVNNSRIGSDMCAMMTDALNSLKSSPIISVALLAGPAVGGGAELSTACDFRIMAPSSYCQFIHGILGASPGWGGLRRLHAIVGRNQALRLLGTSVKLNAIEALQISYADAIVPPDHSPILYTRNQFLQPYSSHRFPNALRTLKHTLASCDQVNEAARLSEYFAFQSRWGSGDNKSAIRDNFISKTKDI